MITDFIMLFILLKKIELKRKPLLADLRNIKITK